VPDVVPLPLGFVNAYRVGGVLVDAGNPGMEARVAQQLGAWKPSLLVITHGHLDHVGSARALAQRYRVPIVMGAADAALAREGKVAPVVPLKAWLKPMARALNKRRLDEPIAPDILVTGERDLADFGLAGRLVPTPGHTDGSISLVLADGPAIVGDLMNGGMPFGRGKPGDPIIGVDPRAMRASVERLHEAGATRYYVGHGAPDGFSRAQVDAWLEKG
jgi:glyoxylase-like metal-dependent hydrolase (beta-lactamase superfamily II)